jgi:anti-sigma factor ChrR (cupin superfamily)
MTEPFNIPEILDGGWKALDFEPFREGIEIAHLLKGEPALAVLRYQPGATVPRHDHVGAETVLVLEGSQTDARGTYRAGALVVNTEGSSHDVVSHDGCVVLVQWSKPIRFVPD